MSKIINVQKVVVPIDFSENSRLIAESAAVVAGKFGAALHLIFIVHNFEDYSGFLMPQMSMPKLEHDLMEGAEQKMADFTNEMRDYCRDCGVSSVQWRVVNGDIGEGIVDFADEIRADMIIMGTHGYKGLEKIVFGSIADKVVRSAACPVLTINPYTCCAE
ncbi:MAG: universal stress protein [Desulfobulbaceae bacterium]|jgi:nucleotide-binding universal stress UspA family protein|nr:universal stress protein [Desulfobulbaceae bacterium]